MQHLLDRQQRHLLHHSNSNSYNDDNNNNNNNNIIIILSVMETAEEPRLPSYNEALEWGIAPPPRPQWAPPREPARPTSPLSWANMRPRSSSTRPISISNIDEAMQTRPRTANPPSGGSSRPLSLLDIGLDAVRADSLSARIRRSTSSARPLNLSAYGINNNDNRPSTSQGIQHCRTEHQQEQEQQQQQRPSPPPTTTTRNNRNRTRPTPTIRFSPPPRTTNHPTTMPPQRSLPIDDSSDDDNNLEGLLRPDEPSAIPDMPASPAYSAAPPPLPLHIRPVVPPTYARHDPTARTYLLRSPFVYTTTGSSPQNAAYQLAARPSKTGRPYQLRIRPLDHIESRTLSLSSAPRPALRDSLEYDDDNTLYLLQVMQLLGGFGVPGLGFGPSWRVEMQRDPRRDSGRNTGFIRFEGGGFLGTGKGWMQRSGCKFWYMTRRPDTALKTAHEWRLIQRYGWQPELEWNKRLLFTVVKKRGSIGRSKGYEWRDGKGRLVAYESAEGRLDLTGLATSMSSQSREALLACWVGKAWAGGGLIW